MFACLDYRCLLCPPWLTGWRVGVKASADDWTTAHDDVQLYLTSLRILHTWLVNKRPLTQQTREEAIEYVGYQWEKQHARHVQLKNRVTYPHVALRPLS